LSEEQFIQALKEDRSAFEQLYEAYYARLFNYTYKRIGDFETSRDIVSEVFLKAYLAIDKFQWRGISIQSWLYRITSNEIKLFFRSAQYVPRWVSQTYEEDLFREANTNLVQEQARADAELTKYEQFLKVQQALKKIPVKYQEVIALKYFEQLQIKEIAQILNKKEGTVKSLLHRGIGLIKNNL